MARDRENVVKSPPPQEVRASRMDSQSSLTTVWSGTEETRHVPPLPTVPEHGTVASDLARQIVSRVRGIAAEIV